MASQALNGTDKDKVKAAGPRAATRVPGVLNEAGHEPDVWLVKFGDSSLDFELVLWAGPELVAKPGSTHALFMWVLEDELRDAGIGIPFPQRDLHVRSGTLEVALKGKTPPKQP